MLAAIFSYTNTSFNFLKNNAKFEVFVINFYIDLGDDLRREKDDKQVYSISSDCCIS